MNLYEYQLRVLDMLARSLRLLPDTAKPPPLGICPECLELRPDDERVANNLKCAECNYGVPQGALSE